MTDEFGRIIPTSIQSMRDEINRMKSAQDVKDSLLFDILKPSARKSVLSGLTFNNQLDLLLSKFHWSEYNKSIWTPLVEMLRELTPLKIKTKFKNQIEIFKSFNSREDLDVCIRKTQTDTPLLVITAMHLTLLRFRELFKLPDFLYVAIRPKSTYKKESDYLCHSFVLSRIHYILHGTYLPILVDIGLPKHATTAVFLPFIKEDDSIKWVRIFIDSSTITKTELKYSYRMYERIETGAFKNFKKWMKDQTMNSASLFKYECVHNIQKHYGTCAHWSTLLMMFFMIQHDDNVEIDGRTVHNWCESLAEKTEQTVTMKQFLDCFLDLRFLFTSYTYRIISSLAIPNDGSDEMPPYTATRFVDKVFKPDDNEQTRNMLKVNRKIFLNALNLFSRTMPMHRFNKVLKESPGGTRENAIVIE